MIEFNGKRIAVTGTRIGMTPQQKKVAAQILRELIRKSACELHHGDCVGVDQEFARMAMGMGFRVVAHPAEVDEKWRAHEPSDGVWPVQKPLTRNRQMVDLADEVFAFPKAYPETKGGTHYTIEYARQKRKKLTIIGPDGREIGGVKRAR